MKAIVTTRYGPTGGLQLQEVPQPVPGARDVLIKVHATTVTAGDVLLRRLPFIAWLPLRLVMGVRRKKIPGHEFAGQIEAVGKAVTRFQQGDQVFGTTTGLSAGANAEYVALPERWEGGVIALKPDNVSYEEATAVPVGGMTALHFLRAGGIAAGQQVLINGASGSVGTFAVQLAKSFGAIVTGVCSTRNVDLVRALGADRVIDYTQEDFTRRSESYDLIFDAVAKRSRSESEAALKEGGVYVSTRATTHEKTENLLALSDLLAAGKVCPVIDRRYPLADVAAAHRYVEQGHKAGNVVITLVASDPGAAA
jgi:NADPH:quinone reductase-like Zn-dependent oxidoreductase